jgi:hypothetical protein
VRWRGMVLEGAAVAEVNALRAAYGRGGVAAMNAEAIRQLRPRAERRNPNSATQLAQAYGRAGNREQTLFWLRRGIALKEDGAIQLRSQRAFDFLKGDREFEVLLVQVGLAR